MKLTKLLNKMKSLKCCSMISQQRFRILHCMNAFSQLVYIVSKPCSRCSEICRAGSQTVKTTTSHYVRPSSVSVRQQLVCVIWVSVLRLCNRKLRWIIVPLIRTSFCKIHTLSQEEITILQYVFSCATEQL